MWRRADRFDRNPQLIRIVSAGIKHVDALVKGFVLQYAFFVHNGGIVLGDVFNLIAYTTYGNAQTKNK